MTNRIRKQNKDFALTFRNQSTTLIPKKIKSEKVQNVNIYYYLIKRLQAFRTPIAC